jgi:hypothetical protein
MSVEVNDYLENILDDLGGCGRFQFLLTFYVLGTKVVVSWSALMMSFGGAVPEWSCTWEDSLGEKYMPNATFTKKCSIENSSMDFTCVNKQYDDSMSTVVNEVSTCSAGFTYRLNILQNCNHPSSYCPLLKLIKHTSIFLQS